MRKPAIIGAAASNARAIAKTHPHLAQFAAFLDEMNKETARGAALTAAAMLDDLLLKILHSFLIEGEATQTLLVGFNAPLGTQASREKAAVAMGLISGAEFAEAETLRKIRNEFAHGVHISFDTPKVVALCKRLRMDAKPYGDMIWDARGAFTTSAVALILNLTNRPHYVGAQRLKLREWDR